MSDRLAREASRLSRVCLVGDGGDELLAGYPRHRALLAQRRMSALPSALHGVPRAIAALVPEHGSHATTVRRALSFLRSIGRPLGQAFLDWTGYVDDIGLSRALGARARRGLHAEMLELFARNAAGPLRAAALVDLRSFVPFNLMTSADRTGMAHPLELRSPFLAPPLVELALSMPASLKVRRGRLQPILVDALGSRLAPGVATRAKRPFNPPIRPWLARNLVALESALIGPRSQLGHVVSAAWVREELECFRAQRRDNSTLLFGLGTLAGWLARSARGGSSAPAPTHQPREMITTSLPSEQIADRASRRQSGTVAGCGGPCCSRPGDTSSLAEGSLNSWRPSHDRAAIGRPRTDRNACSTTAGPPRVFADAAKSGPCPTHAVAPSRLTSVHAAGDL